MPGTLHEQLAEAAEGEEVSLNRFVNDTLAAAVSPGPHVDQRDETGRSSAPGETASAFDRRSSRTFRLALATNVALMVLAGLAAIVLLVLALHQGI
jgi:hypothetical protein